MIPEMTDAAKRAGHKSKSKNFRNIVALAIITNRKLFKRVARGQYTAKQRHDTNCGRALFNPSW